MHLLYQLEPSDQYLATMNIAPVPYCYSVERDDWISVYRDFPATHILTLHFEPEFGGKVCPVERISPETGEIRTIAPSSHWRPESKSLPSSVEISMKVAQRVMRHFWNHVDRKVLGSHYHNRSLNRRSQYLGVGENLGTNAHIHCKWYVPEGRADRFTGVVAQEIWDKVWGRGRVCMQDIRDDTDAWSVYVTKNLMYDEEWCDADRVIISPTIQN